MACSSGEEPAPDAFRAEGFCDFYMCLDHTLWKLPPTPRVGMGCGAPNTNGVEAIATCELGCRTATAEQTSDLCVKPPPATFACTPPATCSSGETFTCIEENGCVFPTQEATFGTCGCDASSGWSCTDACVDGLCGAAAVQAAMVGTWRGSITHSDSSNVHYQATLDIAADGAWRMYDLDKQGNDFGGGGTPGSSIFVRGQTASGGVATIRVIDASEEKPLVDIRVSPDRLQFKLGWNVRCTWYVVFDLQRISKTP